MGRAFKDNYRNPVLRHQFRLHARSTSPRMRKASSLGIGCTFRQKYCNYNLFKFCGPFEDDHPLERGLDGAVC